MVLKVFSDIYIVVNIIWKHHCKILKYHTLQKSTCGVYTNAPLINVSFGISYYNMRDSSINAELKLENINDDKSQYGVLVVALACFTRNISVSALNMSNLHSSSEHTAHKGKFWAVFFELTKLGLELTSNQYEVIMITAKDQ